MPGTELGAAAAGACTTWQLELKARGVVAAWSYGDEDVRLDKSSEP